MENTDSSREPACQCGGFRGLFSSLIQSLDPENFGNHIQNTENEFIFVHKESFADTEQETESQYSHDMAGVKEQKSDSKRDLERETMKINTTLSNSTIHNGLVVDEDLLEIFIDGIRSGITICLHQNNRKSKGILWIEEENLCWKKKSQFKNLRRKRSISGKDGIAVKDIVSLKPGAENGDFSRDALEEKCLSIVSAKNQVLHIEFSSEMHRNSFVAGFSEFLKLGNHKHEKL